jgi:hypothetical protein
MYAHMVRRGTGGGGQRTRGRAEREHCGHLGIACSEGNLPGQTPCPDAHATARSSLMPACVCLYVCMDVCACTQRLADDGDPAQRALEAAFTSALMDRLAQNLAHRCVPRTPALVTHTHTYTRTPMCALVCLTPSLSVFVSGDLEWTSLCSGCTRPTTATALRRCAHSIYA